MRKKLFVFTLAAAMTFSLAACGGSSSSSSSTTAAATEAATTVAATEAATTAAATEAAATEAAETVVTSEERSADYMTSMFTIGAAGLDEDGNYWFLASDADVSFIALVCLSQTGEQSFNAVGTVEENGSELTINDTTSGYSMTFNVESIDEGIQLTLENGTVVVMAGADVESVVNMIIAIDNGTEIVNPLAEDSEAATEAEEGEEGEEAEEGEATESIADSLETCYVGTSESTGAGVAYLANADGSATVLALINADGTIAASYVGSIETDDTGLTTFTNAADGDSMQAYLIAGTDDDGNECIVFTQDGETGFNLYEADLASTIEELNGYGLEF